MRKGDIVTWKDVNGKEHSGTAEKIISITYLVKMPNGKDMVVTKRYSK